MENEYKKNRLQIIFIIVLIILFLVVTALYITEKIKNENNIKSNNENTDIIGQENNKMDNSDNIKEKLIQNGNYYCQNYGNEENFIWFNEDSTFVNFDGWGGLHSGKYTIKGNTITCSIDTNSSEWHKKEEKLEETVEITFEYNESKNILQVVNITKPTLTIHIIDIITGELTEDTKEYSLEQFSVGNTYSAENKYEENV